jgi:hypothetical protein
VPTLEALLQILRINVSKKDLLLFHWFVCSGGLIGILYGLSWKIHVALQAGSSDVRFHEWATFFFNPAKPQELLFACASGVGLLTYFLILLSLVGKAERWRTSIYAAAEQGNPRFFYLYILLPVTVNVIVYALFPSGARSSLPLTGYLMGVIWLGTLLLPFYPSLQAIEVGVRGGWLTLYSKKRVWSYAVMGILAFVCIQFVMVFLPFTTGNLLMMNEYWDIPEYTRIGDRYISNTQFFREHNIGGLLKYEPDSDHGHAPLPRAGMSVEVPRTLLLEQFIARHRTDYYYHDETGALVIRCAMLPEERQELAIVFHEPELQAKINGLYFASGEQCDRLSDVAFTAEEEEFLAKNYLELRWQIMNRWVLHHHNFVLGPINEYAMGKPLEDINAQYGVFNVVLMRWLLEKTGGISYQNYFQKWYAWWLVYYLLFLGLAYLLFRNVYYVTLVCVLVFGFINTIDYQFLFLGPGLNPIRHFWDLPVVACLNGYLKTRRGGVLVLALLFALIGVVNNKQFGGFLIVALVVALLTKSWQERERSLHPDVRWVVGTAIVLGLMSVWAIPGKDIMGHYYRQGFLGFASSSWLICLLLFIIGGGYLLLLRLQDLASEWKYLAFFLLVYSQGLLIYGLWGGTSKHMLNISSVLVLSGVVFLKLVIDQSRVKSYESVLVGGLTIGALAFVYVPGLSAYYTTKTEYEKVFATHRTYDWNLERAQFRSTMDPAYFVESVSLIQQYANSGNGIYIISKYDTVLPFLAKRYSAMPFFDVPWMLLTDHEVNLCIESIRANKPRYLFVDTDIERNLNTQILVSSIPRVGNAGSESLLRVQRLNLLKDVFTAVKDDYEPDGSRGLLTVYKRKVPGDMEKLLPTNG